ncbi:MULTISPECIES: hypothetical protein [Bacillus cereus group]|uniref:hypothetical protein n=1 Tax=Bacillus cereus group TaxID=86661 RepID=UPI00119D29F1|nr:MULTISPECIES: hypothetical protein [Bacillus cereus group]MDF9638826.1 hypothetical protein [Bacillus cereus]
MITTELTLKGTLTEINTAVTNLKTIENVVRVGTPMRRGGQNEYFVVVEIEVQDNVYYVD